MRNDSRKLIYGFMGAMLLSAALQHTLRAEIIQLSGDNGFSNGGNPFVMGQSFEANLSVATLGSIGFSYLDSNTFLPDTMVTIDLFEGLGYGGTLVDSASVTVARNLGDRFINLDFSGVSLISGNDYSFRLGKGSGAGGVWFKPGADLYADGTRLDASGFPVSGDLAFRVSGVPEPSSLALAAIGLCSICMLARSRRRRVRE